LETIDAPLLDQKREMPERGALFALVLSYLFHPLLIPTYGMYLLYLCFARLYYFTDIQFCLHLLSITFIATGLLPAISSLILLRTGFIRSLEMKERQERTGPFLFTVIYYLFAYYLLRNFPAPVVMATVIRLFTLGAAVALLITALISLRWKISAHLVAIGGLTGAVAGLSIFLPNIPSGIMYGSVFLSGFIGYARLRLNAHTPAQVYAGYLLGFGCTFVLICFF
jgi:hypothetical protein